jgi:hypothetical protein
MKKLLIASSICLVAVLLLFMATDPNKLPSFVLIVPFVLLFVLLSTIIMIILKTQGMADKKSLKMGLSLAGVPLILLVLQSIGQLTLRDVLTIGILFAISYFYVSRSTASS